MMTRDEFEKLLDEYTNEVAHYTSDRWEKLHTKLLTAYDEMAAEIEHLRWFSPANGELPPDECDIYFVVDDTVDLGCYADRKFWNGNERGICPERVTRWRYVH